MSIVIFKRPERAHKEIPTLKCRWQSAHQPIIFGFQRKDLVAVPYDIGTGKLGFLIPNYADYGTAKNDYINTAFYIADTSGLYDTTGVITSVATIGLSGTDLYCDTDLDYLGAGADTWFNFYKPNYRVELTLSVFNPVTQKTSDEVIIVRPYSEGRAEINVQNFITDNLKKELGFQYDAINYIDNNAWGKFTMKWREMWTGVGVGSWVNDPYTYYFIDGVKYLGNTYGQNYFDYLPVAYELGTPAKFMTMFNKPTYFVGYPFDLSFIYPDLAFIDGIDVELPSIPMRLRQTRKNLSGQTLNSQTDLLDSGKSPGIAHVMLNETLPSGCKFVDVYLDTGTIVPASYYDSGYLADGYFDSFPPEVLSTVYQLTQVLRVKVSTPCDKSPVFLRWRNPLGGWDYWCFDANYEIEPIAKDNGSFISEPSDLETASYRKKTISTDSLDRITCGAYIDEDDWSGLKWIESSPCVQMLTDLDALKWLEVSVGTGGMKRLKRGNNFEVRVTFDMPNYYSVPN